MNRNKRLVGFQMLRALVVATTASAGFLSAAHGHHTPEHSAEQAAGVQVRQAFAGATMPGAPTAVNEALSEPPPEGMPGNVVVMPLRMLTGTFDK